MAAEGGGKDGIHIFFLHFLPLGSIGKQLPVIDHLIACGFAAAFSLIGEVAVLCQLNFGNGIAVVKGEPLVPAAVRRQGFSYLAVLGGKADEQTASFLPRGDEGVEIQLSVASFLHPL